MAKVRKIAVSSIMKTLSVGEERRRVIFQDFTHGGKRANRAQFDRQLLNFFVTCELEKTFKLERMYSCTHTQVFIS